MKKTIAAVLAIVLSLCLLLCFPVAVSAEEDLISHYNGDDVEYLRFLFNYFYEKCDSSDGAVYYAGLEMAKMVNTCQNDLQSHPYLMGTIDPETGEITITGMQVVGFKEEAQGLFYAPESYTKYDRYRFFACKSLTGELVIPDEIDGHPVTRIADGAFYRDRYNREGVESFYSDIFRPASIVIGDNVREIGAYAFQELFLTQEVTFGKNVQVIGNHAFESCGKYGSFEIKSWGDSLTTIQESAFFDTKPQSFPPFPDTLKTIGRDTFACSVLPDTITIPQSVETLSCTAFHDSSVKNIVILSNSLSIQDMSSLDAIDNSYPFGFFAYNTWSDSCLYCYAGSTAEAFAQESCDPYQLIDGDSLLLDGEAVEGNALINCVGMTEAELRTHLGIDGTSSEIQIDGLRDGKVVNGTTVTLFHTVAQAPGKVYTVSAENMPVFTVGTVEADPGDTIDVTVTLAANSGLAGTILQIAYDTTALTMTGADRGMVFSGDYLFSNDLTVSPCTLIWYDALSTSSRTETGVLCTLHFTVSQDAAAGEYPITVTYEANSTFDIDMNNVVCVVENGGVTVRGWIFSEDCASHVWTSDETGESFITGLDPDDPAIDGYIDTFGGWSYEVTQNDMDCDSTGALVTIYDENHDVAEQYETVLFGDVDGDGQCGIDDAMEIIALVCLENTSEWTMYDEVTDYAQSMAADFNHDCMVDINDAMEIIAVSSLLQAPNQQWMNDNDPYALF